MLGSNANLKRYRIINQTSQSSTRPTLANQAAAPATKTPTPSMSSVKTRSKSVDTRDTLHNLSLLNATVNNTVNSFDLETSSKATHQRAAEQPAHQPQQPPQTQANAPSYSKAYDFRQLEAKHRLERDKLNQIMKKLDADLLNAKRDLLEEDSEGIVTTPYDDQKFKHHESSTSSLCASGLAISALHTIRAASSYASTLPSSLIPTGSVATNAPPQALSWLEENYYDNNHSDEFKLVQFKPPPSSLSFKKKPARRHSIASLTTAYMSLEVRAKPKSNHFYYTKTDGKINEPNAEVLKFIKSTNEQITAGRSDLASRKLASKSISNLPSLQLDSQQQQKQRARLVKTEAKLINQPSSGSSKRAGKIIESEHVKRTIENLSPLSISASSVSSSASANASSNSSLSNSLAGQPEMNEKTGNSLATAIADEVGSIGCAFNRISSSSPPEGSSINEDSGYEKCNKFESFI